MITDMNQLLNLAKENKSASEIMETLSIRSKSKLRELLYLLSIEKGEMIKVPGMSKTDPRDRKLTKINLTIPTSIVGDQFKEGDVFRVEIFDDKIVLTLKS